MLTDHLALDLETTGFSPSDDGIVEISALRVERGEAGRHLSTLVNPGRPIPPGATAIHGLRDQDVAQAPGTGEALEMFLAFLDGPRTLMVAHNAGFDASFLGHGFLRMERDLPQNPILDSLSLAREAWPGVPSRSLEALALGYGVLVNQKHRALADCETLARVLPLLVRDLPGPPGVLEDLAHPFPEVAFPPTDPPAGWEGLDLAAREGRDLEVRWRTRWGPESARLQPLRLVRRGWRVHLLARRLDGGRTLEIQLRDLVTVDGRRPPPALPYVPALRDRVVQQIAAGASLQEAAERLGTDPSQALRHLCEALVQGVALDLGHLVAGEVLEQIRACLDSALEAPLLHLKSLLQPGTDWVQLQLGLAWWHGAQARAAGPPDEDRRTGPPLPRHREQGAAARARRVSP